MIDRERARTLRTGVEFSLILFRARRTRRAALSTQRLAAIILSRARATDEVGWFDDDHVCLLLPDTGNAGAWHVAADLDQLLAARAPKPLFSVYTYATTGFERIDGAPGAPQPLSPRDRAGVAARATDHAHNHEDEDDHNGSGGPPGGNGHGGNGRGDPDRRAYAQSGNGN
ncbi:MAG: hypothetical protein WBD40_22685, partial [Tepidisphaeraceae bacterium]